MLIMLILFIILAHHYHNQLQVKLIGMDVFKMKLEHISLIMMIGLVLQSHLKLIT